MTTSTAARPTIVISEDPRETMLLAGVGPAHTADVIRMAADPHLSDADYELIEAIRAEQARGEAAYLEAWKVNAIAEADRLGYDVEFAHPGEDAHRRVTSTPYDRFGDDTVERVVWQAAHDDTALPDGWDAR